MIQKRTMVLVGCAGMTVTRGEGVQNPVNFFVDVRYGWSVEAHQKTICGFWSQLEMWHRRTTLLPLSTYISGSPPSIRTVGTATRADRDRVRVESTFHCSQGSHVGRAHVLVQQHPYTGSCKINGAKFSDTCSVRANWLCMGWPFSLAEMRRKFQTE